MKIPDIIQAAHPYGTRFQNWLKFILQWECEYNSTGHIRTENVPGDGGGLTFAGIDKRSHPNFNYENPTPEAVAKCYVNDYWIPSKASSMKFPVGEVVANYSVNMGLGASVKLLQRAVNSCFGDSRLPLVVDGGIGPKTIESANLCDPRNLADLIEDEATKRYRGIVAANPSQSKFLKGWLNRNAALEKWWMNLPDPS